MELSYEPESGKPLTLYDKIFRDHVVNDGEEKATPIIYIDRHLVHEVTSPQAFEGLRDSGRTVRRVDCTLSTVDHNVPTSDRSNYVNVETFIKEKESRVQVMTLEQNVKEFGLTFYGLDDNRQGIVHIIGPEQGFTLPGTTVVCGDSHTSTHGAFGALAFGIGTSEVEHVLATQTLLMLKSKNMKVQVDGELTPGTTSKDVMLHIIGVIGTAGGTGHVIEFCGSVIDTFSIEARMSMCNMSIEAGARAGLVAPDEVTFEYVKGRPLAPKMKDWDRAVTYWKSLRSDPGATFDKVVVINGSDIIPTVTWGTSPEDVVPITGVVPDPASISDPQKRSAMERSLNYMGLTPGTLMTDLRVDKVFIGSCTNGRIEDLRAVATVAKGRKVAAHVDAMIVPGSGIVKQQAEAEGLDVVFKEAGFDWREPGCSMCLAMNPDKLLPEQRCAATSNRNFEGRQGAKGRTHLVSPAMAAAAAVMGHLTDVRALTGGVAYEITATDSKKYLNDVETSTVPIIPTFKADSSLAGMGGGASKSFTILEGKVAHLNMTNIDTDMIIPKQFLKTVKRTGLGVSCFYTLRYLDDGKENSEFVLNQPQYRDASILVTGANFGCGSSREHAPWALLDMGIWCIIATSFADIFYNNCFKNGMLPIVLPADKVALCLEDAKAELMLKVDLMKQTVTRSNGESISFEVNEFRKYCLVNGLDDIGLTLQKVDLIESFEVSRSSMYPWLDGPGYTTAKKSDRIL